MKTFLVVSLAPYSKAWTEIPVKSLGDLKTAWDMGYDFKISGMEYTDACTRLNGPYCSNRDIEQMKLDGIDGIILRHEIGTIQLPF